MAGKHLDDTLLQAQSAFKPFVTWCTIASLAQVNAIISHMWQLHYFRVITRKTLKRPLCKVGINVTGHYSNFIYVPNEVFPVSKVYFRSIWPLLDQFNGPHSVPRPISTLPVRNLELEEEWREVWYSPIYIRANNINTPMLRHFRLIPTAVLNAVTFSCTPVWTHDPVITRSEADLSRLTSPTGRSPEHLAASCFRSRYITPRNIGWQILFLTRNGTLQRTSFNTTGCCRSWNF